MSVLDKTHIAFQDCYVKANTKNLKSYSLQKEESTMFDILAGAEDGNVSPNVASFLLIRPKY